MMAEQVCANPPHQPEVHMCLIWVHVCLGKGRKGGVWWLEGSWNASEMVQSVRPFMNRVHSNALGDGMVTGVRTCRGGRKVTRARLLLVSLTLTPGQTTGHRHQASRPSMRALTRCVSISLFDGTATLAAATRYSALQQAQSQV